MAQLRMLETARGRFGALVEEPPGPAAATPGGPPVLLVHGFPDDASTFADLQRALAGAGHRSTAAYLRGYAPSPTDGDLSLTGLADDLVALADAVSPTAPVLYVGHDWGAIAGWAALARRPDRFTAAVLLAGPHPRAFVLGALRRPRQWVKSSYVAVFQVPGVAERLVGRDAVLRRMWRGASPALALPPEHLARVGATLRASLPAPVAMYRHGLRGAVRTGRVAMPVLSVMGQRDGALLPSLTDGQERLVDAPYERIVLPGTGHWVHLEQPQRVAAEVLRWSRTHAR